MPPNKCEKHGYYFSEYCLECGVDTFNGVVEDIKDNNPFKEIFGDDVFNSMFNNKKEPK